MGRADGSASARQNAVVDQGHAVRHSNARSCLLALREASSPLTLSELASRTGLSRPTVGAVLHDLSASGLITHASPTEPGQPGRPARRVALDPSAVTVAALDIGATSVRSLVADGAGRIIARATVPATGGIDLDAMGRAAQAAGTMPGAVGIAVPGIVGADGRISQSLARPDLVGLDLGAELEQRLGCPVIAENDIKLAALAEHHLGRPAETTENAEHAANVANAENIAFIQIGHRISVALIVGGVILQGSHRLAGELGIQRGMRWTAGSTRGRLTWSTGDEAQPLLERAAAGDAAAQREVEEFCAEIAPRLATVLLTIDPELVVVGGGLSRAGETLLDPLRRSLHHLLMTPDKPGVVAARLTTDGSLVGALGGAFAHGSEELLGIPAVPPPWSQFLTTPPAEGASRID